MRRALIILFVGALLVSGGIAVAMAARQDNAAATTGVAQQSVAQQDTTDEDVTDDAPQDDTTTDTDRSRDAARTAATANNRGRVLSEVLDDLVADGVITQDQADQILEELTSRLEELRLEMRGDGQGSRGFGRHGFQLPGRFGAFLDDGVIDSDELAQLGEAHPLNDPEGPAAPYLEDGQITQEELEELMAELAPFGRRGHSGTDQDDESDAEESSF